MTDTNESINIISLGAGVQSSTLALMVAHGEIDYKVSGAVFSDTQAEPKNVYVWLEYLKEEIAKLPYSFPVHVVTAGSLTESVLKDRYHSATGKYYVKPIIPAFAKNSDGTVGLFLRACTQDFKVVPVVRKIKELLGYKKYQRVPKGVYANNLMGISLDEAHRMKPSRDKHIKNVYPLVDNDITRLHCYEWMKQKGYKEPPRSACSYCPFHSDEEWIRLKKESPEDFKFAVDFEKKLQDKSKKCDSLQSMPYLHRSCVPISEVEFDKNKNLNLFGNECDGHCGL